MILGEPMGVAACGYRDLGPWYRFVQRAFSLLILVSLVSAGLHLGAFLQVLGPSGRVPDVFGHDGQVVRDVVAVATSAAYLLVFSVCGVSFLGFKIRAARNLRALNVPGLQYDPWWAVASYFIPVVNLVVPYRAMREILVASTPGPSLESPPDTPALTAWWSLWLTSAAVGFLLLRSLFPDTPEEIMVSASLHLLSDCVDIGLAASVLTLLGQVFRRQSARAGDRPGDQAFA